MNIGSGSEISIGNLAGLIADLMEAKVNFLSDELRVRPEKSEVERLVCDNTKLSSINNWKPEYDLKKGLLETIEWLKQNLKYYKSELYNV